MYKSDNIKLIILTPQETLFEGLVQSVDLPGCKGRFMILRNHAPIISFLSEGYVVYTSEGVQSKQAVSGGFVRVNDNEVVVCVEL